MKSTELNEPTVTFEDALKEDDPKVLAKAMDARFKQVEDKVLAKYDELKDEQDQAILRTRGVYQLTNEEKAFYDKLFKNAVGNNPAQGATLTIPKTIVDRVFEDMKNEEYGILDLVDFNNTTGLSEWLVNVAEKPSASWGDLTEGITKELSFGFKVVSTLVNKLSCYVPYCKSFIDLGYSWQDVYVRTYMAMGLSSALSISAISGDGAKKPWGMAYDYDMDNDTGTKKTAVAIKKFDKKAFAPLFAKICKNPMGLTRSLKGLTMIVDTETYYDYVFANNGDINSSGVYVTVLDQLGIALRVTETGLAKGEAILGLPKRQFIEMGFKGNPNGFIEFSDDCFFLEDKRVYKGKLYADGFPKDNNAFVLLDLTGMNGAASA